MQQQKCYANVQETLQFSLKIADPNIKVDLVVLLSVILRIIEYDSAAGCHEEVLIWAHLLAFLSHADVTASVPTEEQLWYRKNVFIFHIYRKTLYWKKRHFFVPSAPEETSRLTWCAKCAVAITLWGVNDEVSQQIIAICAPDNEHVNSLEGWLSLYPVRFKSFFDWITLQSIKTMFEEMRLCLNKVFALQKL